jgi:hypothetical protein
MRFIGLDLHKKTLVLCALDRRGRVLFRETVACHSEALLAFARARLRRTDRLAVEATTATWAVAEILRSFVTSVTVANPLQVKAIAQAEPKEQCVPRQSPGTRKTMQRNATVHVKGRVRHADQATVRLHGWHRVLIYTETESKAMRNVAFLD